MSPAHVTHLPLCGQERVCMMCYEMVRFDKSRNLTTGSRVVRKEVSDESDSITEQQHRTQTSAACICVSNRITQEE